MFRKVFRPVGFERAAIAFTGLCVASLYFTVALDFTAAPAPEPAPPASEEAAKSAGHSVIAAAQAMPTRRLLKPVQVFTVASTDKLADMFHRIGYHLDRVREHGRVPRVFLASIPEDLTRIRIVEKRKVMFIQTALPLILHVNEVILHDRDRIKALHARMRAGAPLDPADARWLEQKAEEYELDAVDFDRLLRRVDIIPPSLALAQSAEESGWGTSRFAQEGNALFGQRVWVPHKKGIVPEDRPDGHKFRVRAFDHLIDGVKSYARNLNSHWAYDDFRKARAALRRDGAPLDGGNLAGSLESYSERGADYVRTLRTIIRVNGLKLFDRVRLGDRVTWDEGDPSLAPERPDA
jgi:Bax protein